MALSQLAQRLLELHAERPEQLFYGVDVLGSLFRDPAIARLDAAYRELEQAHLMQPTGQEITYFGEPERLFRLTPAGAAAAREPAA